MVICRIEYFGKHVCVIVFDHCLVVITLRKELHIEVLHGFCFPEPEHGHGFAVLARYHHIVSDRFNVLTVDIIYFEYAVFSPLFFHSAAKTNNVRFIRTLSKPRLASGQPHIGQLGLPAVDYLLLEQTVFVSQRIAHCGVVAGCQRIHKACSQSSESTITQTCVRFQFIKFVKRYAIAVKHLFECLCSA